MGSILGLLFGLCAPNWRMWGAVHPCAPVVPPVCWVVLALVWFGFNGWPCVFISGRIHHSDGGDQPEHGVRGVTGTSGDGEALPLFPAEVPLHVTPPLSAPILLSA